MKRVENRETKMGCMLARYSRHKHSELHHGSRRLQAKHTENTTGCCLNSAKLQFSKGQSTEYCQLHSRTTRNTKCAGAPSILLPNVPSTLVSPSTTNTESKNVPDCRLLDPTCYKVAVPANAAGQIARALCPSERPQLVKINLVNPE